MGWIWRIIMSSTFLMSSRNYRDRRSSSEHNRRDEKRCHICRTMVLTRNYVRHVNGHQRYPVSRKPYGRPPGCRNQPGYTMAQIRAMESAQSNYPRDVVPDHDLLLSVKRCANRIYPCLLYTSPSPRDRTRSRMPSSA